MIAPRGRRGQPLLASQLLLPQTRIIGHESHRVYLQHRDEGAASALISVAVVAEMLVHLVERFEAERRKAEPRRTHVGAFPDSQSQATNRQEIGRRTETQID